MDLALVVNPLKSSTLKVIRRVRAVVPRQKHRLLLWAPPVERLLEREDYRQQLDGYELVDDVREADIVAALGGDGTLLTAVRLLQNDLRPLLGINLGSLGFLTDTPEDDVEVAIQCVLDGRFQLDSRMLLEAVYRPREGEAIRMRGLNDVVLNHGPLARVLEVSMRAAGVDLGRTMSDGVIVASPSGSTAYSLSAGGPIVSPQLRALIMTPINAHTLSMRPLVVGANEGIEIRLHRTSSERAELTVDGHPGCEMREGDHVVVHSAPSDLQLVVTRETSFYDTLRTKLSWGIRGPQSSV